MEHSIEENNGELKHSIGENNRELEHSIEENNRELEHSIGEDSRELENSIEENNRELKHSIEENNRKLELSKILFSSSLNKSPKTGFNTPIKTGLNTPPKTGGTKRVFTLYEKAALINCCENERLSVRELTKRFNCGKTAVYDILKRKTEILEECRAGGGSKKRKPKANGNGTINDSVWQWFVDNQCSGVTVTGPMLQAQAKLIAESLGKTDFKASNGWLESFRNRHCIRFKQSGGGRPVDYPLLQMEWERSPERLEFAEVKEEPEDFVYENETETLGTSSSPTLSRVDAESNSSSVLIANTYEKPIEHQTTTTTVPDGPSLSQISSDQCTLPHIQLDKQCESAEGSISTEQTFYQRRLEIMEKEHEMRMEVLRIEKETAEINRDIAMKKRTWLTANSASSSN